jgi:general secretion pathway protein H
MRPTSPAGSARRAGFVLAEVLVALAVLALIAAIVLPRLASGTDSARLKVSAMQLAGILRNDRVAAMQTGAVVVTGVDLAGRSVASGATRAAMTLPADVTLNVTYAAVESNPGVRFFPNGSSSGASLTLVAQSVAYDVRVDWFTGAVNVEGPHAP